MKKIFNKIMCFVSVFFLLVPLLCFCVCAENIKIDLAYYGIDTFNYNTDGLKFNSDDINTSGGLLFSAKNFVATKISKDDLRKKYQNDVNGRYYNIPPYDYIEYSDGTYSIQAVGDKYIQFLNGLDYLHSSTSLNNFVINYNSVQNYYYFVFYYSYSTPDNYYDSSGSSSRFEEVTHIDTSRCVTYISTTPFSFKSSPNGYYLDGSQKYVAITGNSVSSGLYNGDPFTTCHSFNSYSSEESILFDKNIIYQFNNDSVVNYNFLGAYTNCDIDVSMFDNTDNLHKGITDLEPKTFSEKVSVKLTPEFGLDMDRIYDKNTGQKDYFKFEVTNNSDTNIQFYCAIVDSGKETLYNDKGQISKFLYRDSYWNYIYDCDYYQLAQKTESKYLGFQTLTKFYINKLRGNFFWVLLKPGEHFEDYIYWENVKILPSTSYDFVLEVCPTNNDIACDSFVSSSEQLEKQFYFSGGSKEHWWTISEDVELDQSVEQYSLDSLSVQEIYRVNFSVLTIPAFSSNVRGGNAKITSGWEDTQKQASNPYYKQNLMTGNVEPVNNYQEFKIGLDDVDVDLDNVGVDSVKEYINYSQNFFKLIKMSFQTFPSLWVLVVFGLTAIIVIAIVRYIRG